MCASLPNPRSVPDLGPPSLCRCRCWVIFTLTPTRLALTCEGGLQALAAEAGRHAFPWLILAGCQICGHQVRSVQGQSSGENGTVLQSAPLVAKSGCSGERIYYKRIVCYIIHT